MSEEPDTYTPRKTHRLSVEVEKPHNDEEDPTRTLEYELKKGVEYTVLEGEAADEALGRAPVSNLTQTVRKSALPR